MATTKSADKPAKKPAVKAAPKSAAKVPAKAAPSKAAKKPAAPRAPAAKKAPAAAKKAAVPALAPEQRRYYVEVAAYYIAERRGFHGGGELSDWVQAEEEIDRLLREGILKP